MLNTDPVNPMWAPMCPLGPEIWGFEAGLGAILSRIRGRVRGDGSAELGQGEGLTKSQLGLPLFLIRVRTGVGLGVARTNGGQRPQGVV